MVRLCGASLALFAFGVTLLLGLGAGNPADSVLLRGWWALVIFCGLGLGAGWVASRVLEDHTRRRKQELTPDPESPPDEVLTAESADQPRITARVPLAGRAASKAADS